MKLQLYITLLLLNIFSLAYSQATGSIESQKFKTGYLGYIGYPGYFAIGNDQNFTGRFFVNSNGEITGTLPSCINATYTLTKNGLYTTNNFKYAFIDYASLKDVTNLKSYSKTEFELSASSQYTSSETCYEMPSYSGFIYNLDGQSEYGIIINKNRLQIFNSSMLQHSVELKVKGKRWDHAHINDEFYALYGCDNKLILAKVNLSTGKDEYIELDNKQAHYAGGNMEFINDKIIISTFFGECSNKSDGYNYWAARKNVGLMVISISKVDLKLLEKTETDIPSDYGNLVTSNKGFSILTVNDIITVDDNIYILTGTTGDPFGIWKWSNGELSFLHTVNDEASIRSGKILNYNGVNYVVYAIDNDERNGGDRMDKIKLASFTDNNIEEISIEWSIDKYPNGKVEASHAWFTQSGILMIPADNGYDTGFLIKIKI